VEERTVNGQAVNTWKYIPIASTLLADGAKLWRSSVGELKFLVSETQPAVDAIGYSTITEALKSAGY
jgi:hypothetical protein